MLFNKFILTKGRGSYLPSRGIVRNCKFKSLRQRRLPSSGGDPPSEEKVKI